MKVLHKGEFESIKIIKDIQKLLKYKINIVGVIGSIYLLQLDKYEKLDYHFFKEKYKLENIYGVIIEPQYVDMGFVIRIE